MRSQEATRDETVESNGKDIGHYWRLALGDDVDVDSHWMELQLLFLAFSTGIQDAVAFPDFGCFVSNQTGNTVIFAIALLVKKTGNAPSDAVSSSALPAIGISLGVFILGIFLIGQLANLMHAVKRRWWLVLSSLVQTLLVVVAAALQYSSSDASNGLTGLGRGVIALLAFSAGAQVGMVRSLKITDITTAMATAAYIDILIDREIFAAWQSNRARNRRLAFLASLVAGSFIGAAARKGSSDGLALVLSIVFKTLATFVFFMVPKERR